MRKVLCIGLMLVLTLCLVQQVVAQTITSNSTGSQGGFTYEFWKDSGGSGTMTLGSGGAFSCQWSGINNILFRKGLRPGSLNQVITYSATYNPSGNSYLCIYGWTRNPLVEYYIVDSWGSWRPPGGTSLGTFTSDGGTYDIYRTTRTNQPSIDGTRTFDQYWSVRTSKRTSGTITFANHVAAWANRGMSMGSLYEVSFCVEGYQSSGSANVNSMSMTTGSGSGGGGTTPPPSSGSYQIVMRARGVSGQENVEVRVGGTRVGNWTMTTSMREYSVTTDRAGGITVHYTNDASGRDVQVDWVRAGSTTHQAESQSTNTGVWQNNQCGGARSEWMHCNGYIGFSAFKNAAVATAAPDDAYTAFDAYPNPAGNELTVTVPEAFAGADLVIFNIKGQMQRRVKVESVANILDISNLAPGVYMLRVSNAQHVMTRKIIKK